MTTTASRCAVVNSASTTRRRSRWKNSRTHLATDEWANLRCPMAAEIVKAVQVSLNISSPCCRVGNGSHFSCLAYSKNNLRHVLEKRYPYLPSVPSSYSSREPRRFRALSRDKRVSSCGRPIQVLVRSQMKSPQSLDSSSHLTMWETIPQAHVLACLAQLLSVRFLESHPQPLDDSPDFHASAPRGCLGHCRPAAWRRGACLESAAQCLFAVKPVKTMLGALG